MPPLPLIKNKINLVLCALSYLLCLCWMCSSPVSSSCIDLSFKYVVVLFLSFCKWNSWRVYHALCRCYTAWLFLLVSLFSLCCLILFLVYFLPALWSAASLMVCGHVFVSHSAHCFRSRVCVSLVMLLRFKSRLPTCTTPRCEHLQRQFVFEVWSHKFVLTQADDLQLLADGVADLNDSDVSNVI